MVSSKDVKALLPAYTCPTIQPVVDYCRQQGRDDLVEIINEYMKQNSQMRHAVKTAVKALREAEESKEKNDAGNQPGSAVRTSGEGS